MKESSKKLPLESEDHHWWPQCVSKHWKDNQGHIHKMSSIGTVSPYKKHRKLGYIPNAHSIKFSGEPTVWDESYEHYFDFVDNNKGFPSIIKWLRDLKSNYSSQDEDNEKIDLLLDCSLSLVVRSPRFRNQIKNNIEQFGGHNASELLISINQRNTFEKFKNSLSHQGKFAVILSNEQEFIFGDGFYQNFVSSIDIPLEPRMIVPILPDICVLYSRPMSYSAKPRLITRELKKEDIDFINQTTMVYSKDYVVYKSQQPVITKNFSCNKFLEYGFNGDPVINAFSSIFN
ncbi:DUF4238 domain-containing protein [Methylomonas koyamae]|uniref:DUF4238 domain-containing protein n=1 Tax=Methylomonas koyamae TaxID=702114 RepID=UPI00112E822C|nr:DUF4238 domain-containing protein [Methylomonas koyamae]